ncbi:lytic transglycosylase domain-containing protein [Natranaerobius thermophilus]|uniref:Lytic transglycosylase catalytic n=1 Tax=Natranaerobius thermophilus (strain ATCC BAA-1301 / DSM 18059 / JW/NM-WN-LF) TaxID=457570 RepID=B2A642_NATTJ|nr:lytic transglycosylase domain-containing protein [Natranaerobius thermophilus]ACB85459.1 Lytic transglycosylase catalytic [Natranaerobius thermophilus JW/NM-WN-LF]
MNLQNSRKRYLIALVIIIITALLTYWFAMPRIWEYLYPKHFQEEVYSIAEDHELDPYLLFAIIKVESKFDEKAISNQGAMGLMQLMPTTGAWAAQNVTYNSFEHDDLFDPKTNIELGSWYLDYLLSEFDQDLVVTLAAYNAGQGNVRQWMEMNIWDGSYEELDNVPYNETKHYVKNVLRDYERYREIYEESYAGE